MSVLRPEASLVVNKAAVGHELQQCGEKFTQDALLSGSVETTTQQNENGLENTLTDGLLGLLPTL